MSHIETAILLAIARRDLGMPGRPEALRHLSECETCRDRLRDLEDWRGAARALAWARAGAYDQDCPDENALVGLVRGTLPKREDEEVRLHLTLCDPCRAQVETLEGELASARQAPAESLPNALRERALTLGPAPRPGEAHLAKGATEARVPAERPRAWWRWAGAWMSGGVAPRLATVGVAVALALVVGTRLLREQAGVMGPVPAPSESVFRQAEPAGESGLALLSPAPHAILAGTGLQFDWRRRPGDVGYRLVVQAADGSVVWQTRVAAPPATFDTAVPLESGATYYWRVEALTAGGVTATTDRRSFRVR